MERSLNPLHPAVHGPPLEYSDWHGVPAALREDSHLWSGCISGALTEDEFAAAFAQAGFSCAQIVHREDKPWRTVAGIEFRSMTIEAVKNAPARPSSVPANDAAPAAAVLLRPIQKVGPMGNQTPPELTAGNACCSAGNCC